MAVVALARQAIVFLLAWETMALSSFLLPKAGLMPFHVWLPEAHPAAPSHVSGLTSGVMIKTGIHGLARLLFLVPGCPPHPLTILDGLLRLLGRLDESRTRSA